MTLGAQVRHLFIRELMLEQRQKYALNGILLYVVSTVFVCKFSFQGNLAGPVWNALFWIILLFAAVNAVAKSFIQESRGRMLYLYTMVNPRALLLAKMAYNALLMLVLGLLGLGFYSLLIGNPVQNHLMFLLGMALGCIGLSTVLTMISAIASKTNNNFTLMAVLGFPVQLPLLLTVIRVTKFAMDGLAWDLTFKYFGVLLALNIIVVALAYLLFPYLWRD